MLIPFPRMGKSLHVAPPASYLSLFQNLHARRPYLAEIGPSMAMAPFEEYADDDGGVLYGYGGEQPLGAYFGAGQVLAGQGRNDLLESELAGLETSGKKRALWVGPRLGKRRRRDVAQPNNKDESQSNNSNQMNAGLLSERQKRFTADHEMADRLVLRFKNRQTLGATKEGKKDGIRNVWPAPQRANQHCFNE